MFKKKAEKILKIYLIRLIYVLANIRFGFRRWGKVSGKSLLIVKLDAIGDYVLFRNFLEEIKKSAFYKDYSITFLGNNSVRDLAETLDKDFVDKFIWIDKKHILKRPLVFFNLINLIYKKFSVVIQPTFSRELIGDLLVRLSGASIRIGINGDTNNILSQEKKVSDKWYTQLIDIKSEINFEFYKNRDFFSQILKRGLLIKQPVIKSINISSTIRLPDHFVVLYPGAQQDFRKWPADNFRLIAGYLIEKYNIDVVICGSSSDNDSGRIINSGSSKRIFDLTGKTNLIQLIYIISRAKLIISNDTSGAHIGAALDIPTIILSQFNYYSRFVPYPPEISDNLICLLPHIADNVSESELINKFKHGSSVDISLIPVDEVKQAINKFL
ncbi:MAG: glycosyltransferase family 9 protein [Patescibacteria group bacterium]|jgi:ADP-heptose:LPS heptosyltransferase